MYRDRTYLHVELFIVFFFLHVDFPGRKVLAGPNQFVKTPWKLRIKWTSYDDRRFCHGHPHFFLHFSSPYLAVEQKNVQPFIVDIPILFF